MAAGLATNAVSAKLNAIGAELDRLRSLSIETDHAN